MEESCSVGKLLNDKCHSSKFARKCGLLKIVELPNLHKELLRERSGISSLEDKDTDFYHHEKKWITGYEVSKGTALIQWKYITKR